MGATAIYQRETHPPSCTKFKITSVQRTIFGCFIYFFIPAQSLKLVGKYCDLQTGDVAKLCYAKETLAILAHSPNQLAVDKSSNTLYFSFDSGQGEYVPAILRINSKKLTILQGPKDAFAIAMNDTSREVYFGGSYGIYRYNPIEKSLKQLATFNLDIWWLFIKKEMLYLIKFPSLSAYCYHNKTMKQVGRMETLSIQQYVVDKHDSIFFINSNGLFGLKNDSNETVLLRNDTRFVGMAMDNYGEVYVCGEDGIYIVNRIVMKVKRVINMQGVLGITFDKNNHIIYSDSHELIRLVAMSNDNYYETINTLK